MRHGLARWMVMVLRNVITPHTSVGFERVGFDWLAVAGPPYQPTRARALWSLGVWQCARHGTAVPVTRGLRGLCTPRPVDGSYRLPTPRVARRRAARGSAHRRR